MQKTDIYLFFSELLVFLITVLVMQIQVWLYISRSPVHTVLNIYLYVSYEEMSRVVSKWNEIDFAEDSMKKKQWY